jgi:hypothetical protein
MCMLTPTVPGFPRPNQGDRWCLRLIAHSGHVQNRPVEIPIGSGSPPETTYAPAWVDALPGEFLWSNGAEHGPF